MSSRTDDSELHVDVALSAADLEQLWTPVDSEENEIPAVGHVTEGTPAAPTDPIDWDFCYTLERGLLGDMIDRYFRATIIGAEKLPEQGPLIVAPNHSGNAFPHDAVVLDGLLWRHSGRTKAAKFRSVYTPQLAAVWWMRFYGIDNWWRRGGGVDMTFGNYDKLLERGDRIIYYPEGVPGIGKGFLKRYQLQHYHSSFVVLADKHDTPIYPVAVVNAEWVNPTSVTFPWLNDFFRRTVGLPFFPVPTVFLAALFPFVFYLAFPCRMVFVVGDAVDVRALLREEMGPDEDTPSREALVRVAERVRQISQANLNAAVAAHGRKPWDLVGLAKSLWKVRGRIFRSTPLGWPYAFLQFARDRERPPARSFVHRWLRDLDILFYYLPLGWIGLALMRVLRKPPYGYRGLTEEERIEREGAFRWTLDTRPLPEREPASGGA
ncbi:MAG TPA: 1-acyl-sn-glycerol-3-phosphate acyltransferase [Longimicrobiaceae bacterium]|nr:1-acyl-sn-glycerol-3-phosphate acyltransferase [Longimicrobiaceae bacterium]